jgi:DNA invertase Pin-like site-specific DNA recombinase
VLVITRLSRAMRSLKHLLALAGELRQRGADLVVLKQHIDTTTPGGRLVFDILGAIEEFQRELIIEGLVAVWSPRSAQAVGIHRTTVHDYLSREG